MSKNTTPRWQNPNKAIPPKIIDPAATPVKPKVVKPGRDYMGPALAALGLKPDIKANATTTLAQNQSLIAAVIIAQALDRFGEKLIDAAAVSQYKRTP